MAPVDVRSVPPWVIQRPPQRPPQSVLPQHNHAPTDPRRSRDPPRPKNDDDNDEDDDEDDDEGLTMASRPGRSGNRAQAAAAAPAAGAAATATTAPATGTTTTTTASSSTAKPTPSSNSSKQKAPATPPTDSDGAPLPILPEPPGKGSGGSFAHRLSILFRPKEGRKWDYLRSAEPVIVPRFHVVNRPATYGSPLEESFSPSTPGFAHGVSSGFSHGGSSAWPTQGGSSRWPGQGSPVWAGQGSSNQGGGPSPGLGPGLGHDNNNPPVQNAYTTPWWYSESQWHGFIESSRYGHLPNEQSRVVDDEEMRQLHPGFGYHTSLLSPLALGGTDNSDAALQRQQQLYHRRWWMPRSAEHPSHRTGGGGEKPGREDNRFLYERIWHLLLHHPLGPLACRLTVLMTSIVALVLAVEIFRRERLAHLGDFSTDAETEQSTGNLWATRQPERTQIIVAIVVDVVAVPYIGYITVDDYTGKPLGLRPPKDRIRLILTDLFFIIFKSMSTALGFEAMIFFNSEGSEGLLKALGAFELIGLISWAMTLTINVFREIERLGG